MKRKFLLFLSCLTILPASHALANQDAPDSADGVVETRIPQPPTEMHKSAIVVSSSKQLENAVLHLSGFTLWQFINKLWPSLEQI